MQHCRNTLLSVILHLNIFKNAMTNYSNCQTVTMKKFTTKEKNYKIGPNKLKPII